MLVSNAEKRTGAWDCQTSVGAEYWNDSPSCWTFKTYCKKYLNELAFAGTIKEIPCGNSRIFLIESNNIVHYSSGTNSMVTNSNSTSTDPLENSETLVGDA